MKFLRLALVLFSTGLFAARAAEVFQVTRQTKTALPAGKEADGMIGDWLIRNDRVVAVIGNTVPGRDANQMVEGVQGAVLDFTSLQENNDELVAFYPMGYRPTGLSAGRAEIVRSGGDSAELKVIRDATKEEPYTSTTIYTLNRGENFLRVRTIHENTSGAPCDVSTNDLLRLDNDIACTQSKGDKPVILLENKWYRAAYGLASLDGRTQRANDDLKQQNLRSIGVLIHYPAINPEQKAKLSLAPGQKIENERALLVGRDAATVQANAGRLVGKALPLARLRTVEQTGAPIRDVFVEITREGEPVTTATSAEDGSVDFPLVDGTYALSAAQIGRPTLKRELVIAGGKLAGAAELKFEPQSRVTIDISEADEKVRAPVKIEFRPKGRGLVPFLGPPKRPNGASNLFFSVRGQDTFPVPAGEYEVHISRGPEYGVVIQDVAVPAGGEARITATLKREVQSPHWLIADLHNHSTGSGDSAAELAGRVLNLACGGIEFAPATEHNRISSYEPTIKALGLEHFITSAAGLELSGRPGPGGINHQIGFPLTIQDDKQGFGAPKTDADPYVQMKRLYDYDKGSPKLMQHNHPEIGWLYFDKNRDGVLDGGFGTRPLTDVMEIRETMLFILADTEPSATRHTSRAFHWLQMLNQGDKILGTANTDAHAVGHESGSMFNYVHLEHDEAFGLDPWDVVKSVRAGHVVMSNGPFMEVSVGQAIPGDTVSAPDGNVTLKVKVQVASWTRIDRVQILVNGRQIADGNFTREKQPAAFSDATVQFEKAISLKLTDDAHLIVVATSESETIGKLIGGRFAKNAPTAVSNPIFVDVDGGGFRPNKDLLGAPLPTGKGAAAGVD